MAAYRMNLLTPVRDSENIGIRLQTPNPNGLKDMVASGRTHQLPKRAFGELKNVLHNQEKTFIAPGKMCGTKSETRFTERKKPLKFDVFDNCSLPKNGKIPDSKFCWAQNIAFTPQESDRLLKPQQKRMESKTVAEINEIMELEFQPQDINLNLSYELDLLLDDIQRHDDPLLDDIKDLSLELPPLPCFDF